MGFISTLETSIRKNNSLLCIGLDTDMNKIPDHLKKSDTPLFAFNKLIIDSTHHFVCCYKPNLAFYESMGMPGSIALKMTVDYLKQHYPAIPIIADAKRGDIGTTSEKYAEGIFDYYNFDAITVSPYLGLDGVEPFLQRAEKGTIVLCRTSNPSAPELQDLPVNGAPLYQHVAQSVVSWNKKYGNCLLVVGATWPEQMAEIRKIAPDLFFLVPGVGSQGGDVKKIVKAGLRPDRSGLIITASRSIIYAGSGQDFAVRAAEEAEKLRDTINAYR